MNIEVKNGKESKYGMALGGGRENKKPNSYEKD